MSVTSLYGSLAASASVFIGISSAFLVNKLVTTEQEYNRLSREKSRKVGEQDQVSALRSKLDDRIAEIESRWREKTIKKVNETIDYFIEKYIKEDKFKIPPEKTDFDEIKVEYKKFIGKPVSEELLDEAEETLLKRRSEIEKALAKSVTRKFISKNTWEKSGLALGIEPDFETVVEKYKDNYDISDLWPESRIGLKDAYRERGNAVSNSNPGMWPDFSNMISNDNGNITDIEADRRTADLSNYSRLNMKKEEANARYERLDEEINLLQDERSSIDASPIRESLCANIVGIILSVVVPTVAYYLTVIGFPDPIGIPVWGEALMILVSWVLGLGCIVLTLYQQVETVTQELS